MNKSKEIHIVGGGLYGCLLAYHFLKKKYKVVIFEKSNDLLNSFNYIKLNNFLLNNGFHGIDLPRSMQLFDFLKKKLNIKFDIFKIKRQLLFKNNLIDYTAKKNEWPSEIQSFLKKDIKYYKNQKVSFFFKKPILKLFKKNSLKYFDDIEKSKNFFLPWFLPSDIKHISSDEGDKFRSLLRKKKISGFVALPKEHTFESIKNKMYKYLISKGAVIHFSTEIKIHNSKIKYFQKDKEIFFNNKSIKRIFYCLSSVFLIKDLSKNHFEKLNNYKKYAINCLIKIKDKNFKNNFSEILCLNKKIYFVNRFYSLNYYKYNKLDKSSYLVLEIQGNKKKLSYKDKKDLITEIKNIFKLKSNPNLIDYKLTRLTYALDKKWIQKAKKILQNKITKKLNLDYTKNFFPINMNKAWINAVAKSQLLE